jgi:DNA-binding response OmpR family regulator
MSKVLLLDDEVALREEIAAFLEKRGWQVSEAGTVAEFKELALHADMAVVDVMLPDGSGFEAAGWLREQHPGCGIILLTALGETQDKVNGLTGGADHYLVKPIALLELDAILQALSRRVVSGWRLDKLASALFAPKGYSLEVSSGERILLELLASHPSLPVSRREVAERFGYQWQDYDERRLEAMVSRLRQRWRNKSGTELPLKTMHRMGYAFTEPLALT